MMVPSTELSNLYLGLYVPDIQVNCFGAAHLYYQKLTQYLTFIIMIL